ncbi:MULTISPECIES: cisplatin damage response ATP-dependent DNA ligase [unclassified Chelatococcus]|uniref:cisplatin damage response ATP-dependent DNA ligase n=1 Tax=unclassified Chelatococcus TaxID=2638111 RepID=UPI001BCF6FD9|nr:MULTISPECIES: cisplatin damage response ATP-dependent DNA ligase [unclassified Chelatococcus]MBS7696731.1 cisplatin damage response ATP-dependent DNA ligase [Chelatococcus sp. YT9]MBX3555296.1 cisplatin damage response ATP-dependent DNA ligase [Chelatococcus sp.]
MNRFAELLDRLSYEPRRNAKLRLMSAYFRETPDPERGFALAALTGALSFANAKPGVIRSLIAERTDPVLFALSYDYVGDLSETVALMWPGPVPAGMAAIDPSPQGEGGSARSAETGGGAPAPPLREGPSREGEGSSSLPTSGHNHPPAPTLTEVVEALTATLKPDLPPLVAGWLDGLDETGRWALLKLITGGLRVGVSARLAKTAVAELGALEADDIEEVWHGLEAPYEALFAWVEGRGDKPEATSAVPFRPPMLAHALEEVDIDKLDPADFSAEWKWDGIRIQAVAGTSRGRNDAHRQVRLYTRTGEDISGAFPDLVGAILADAGFDGAIDGELLIMRGGLVQSFNVLQQRLNRKSVTPKLVAEYPAHIRAYDLLAEAGEDLRALPFSERRQRLERFVRRLSGTRIDLSPLVVAANWDALAAARMDPASAGGGADAAAIEGLMLKRHDSTYVPGRPKGPWFKWKRDPHTVDAVLMYAQRGHGKRSSLYSDYTFGVWRGPEGEEELVPVGKAYFGFTDEELTKLDRFVRQSTVNRFGPVREVVHARDSGLVLEVAFEGLQSSPRHKSGIAMRFPRISRIRWDKPPREADRIEFLEALLRGKD